MDLFDIPSLDILQGSHRTWVEESLGVERSARDSKWSESIAEGNKGFVVRVKKRLCLRAKGRKITKSPGECNSARHSFLTAPFLGMKTVF
jgi:hypothetical protein